MIEEHVRSFVDGCAVYTSGRRSSATSLKGVSLLSLLIHHLLHVGGPRIGDHHILGEICRTGLYSQALHAKTKAEVNAGVDQQVMRCCYARSLATKVAGDRFRTCF